MKKIKIGIVGCGAIGKSLAKFIERELFTNAKLAAICDINLSQLASLIKGLKKSKPEISDLENLIRKSDLVIECASAKVSYLVARKSILKGRNVLIMSIGGIVTKANELFKFAQQNKTTVYLPSGAICGLDGIKALSLAGIRKVKLITRKPPKSLEGIGSVKKEKIIFKGNALEAIEKFPKNINVSVLLSIAGIGAKKTEVQIITSPKFKRNSHEVLIESNAGKIRTVCENVAFKENPKTSYLAALSAMSVLKSIFSSARIGN